jgi:hypothetical protein
MILKNGNRIIIERLNNTSAGGVAFSVLFHDFTPFSFHSVAAQEAAEAVFSIKSEAIGLNNVSFKFLKLLAPSFIPHITNFFNFFFTLDISPADWKVSKIIPLPKKYPTHQTIQITTLLQFCHVYQKLGAFHAWSDGGRLDIE